MRGMEQQFAVSIVLFTLKLYRIPISFKLFC